MMTMSKEEEEGGREDDAYNEVESWPLAIRVRIHESANRSLSSFSVSICLILSVVEILKRARREFRRQTSRVL